MNMSIPIFGPGLQEIGSLVRADQAWPATLFLDGPTLVTVPPPVHGLQRRAYIAELDRQRAERGEPPLTDDEADRLCLRSVDLFLKPDGVQIRPHPEYPDFAFAADELLADLFGKRRRRFLNVDDLEVQRRIKERGELWRISVLPGTRTEIDQHIAQARVAIGEHPIYYYNIYSGTRFVTCADFAGLARLEPAALARQLNEIATYARGRNRLGRPEVDFFKAQGRFGAANFAGTDFTLLAPAELAAHFELLRAQFAAAVPPEFHRDDPGLDLWRAEMYSTLISQRDNTETEIVLAGLNVEFKQRMRWLPGGRFDRGELVFDPVFDEPAPDSADLHSGAACDGKVKEILFNLIREYGLIDWVNFGAIMPSPSTNPKVVSDSHANEGGRRDVYLVQLKATERKEPITLFLRLQKWGVRERLKNRVDLADALLATEEYTEYILDRRLGCWYLGVNVPLRLNMRRLQEPYEGDDARYINLRLPVTYFQRDFIPGYPANQLPRSCYEREEYPERLAGLLGEAAAANLIVGRGNDISKRVVFDVGDEIVVEDERGLPRELHVGDHAGSFVCYSEELETLARDYARPVNNRADRLAHPAEFARLYLEGFERKFRFVQQHYRERRRAFDSLFQHTGPVNPAGNFPFRWASVLRRLDAANPAKVVQAVREHIAVLPVRGPA